MQKTLLTIVLLSAIVVSCSEPSRAALTLTTLDDYTQDFDFLDFQGQPEWNNDQSTQDESGSPGWYWQDGSGSLSYDSGLPFSPGAYSLGSPLAPAVETDRAMGSRTDDATPNLAWGIVFENNSGQTISEISLSFTGEQWRRAETSSDSLSFSFTSSASEITDLLPAAGATPAGWTSVPGLTFDAPLAPGTPPYFDPPAEERPLSDTFSVSVPNGHFVALRWHDGDVAGSDAGLGIDDLTVSFAVQAIPEASSVAFGCLIACFAGLYYGGGWALRRTQTAQV